MNKIARMRPGSVGRSLQIGVQLSCLLFTFTSHVHVQSMSHAQWVPGAASLRIRRSVTEPDNTSTTTELRQIGAGFLPQRSGFNPGSLQVRFVVDEVALEQVFLRVLRFSPFNHHSTAAPHSSITATRVVPPTKRAIDLTKQLIIILSVLN
jgi:hypothetical protein